MASTADLRSRRSAAQLYALAGVEREIRANDSNGHRKYLQEFSRAFREYESVLDAASVQRGLQAADVVLIGDYHALPAAQKCAASLVEQRALAGDRPVVLGVETIFARDQHILEEWWRREIDEGELRQRIRFDLDWGYGWAPFYELLGTARDHAEAIYGLDCMPREDLRKIGARDRHAADKIVEMRERHPNAVIMVLFGESHLAPGHLPRILRERLGDARVLTLLQNVDALYWRAAGERKDAVEAVRVNDDVLCVFNATPLEKYESYRLFLDQWSRADADGPDFTPTIYNLIDSLLSVLEINRYSPHNGSQPRFLVDLLPEVYCRSSDAMLRRLLSRKGVKDEEQETMLRRVDERGSAYLPQVNAFYVREFQMAQAAEDAAQFLHHACQGLPQRVNGHNEDAGGRPQLDTADVFYARVLEQVLAYFGSRVLYPARPPLRDADVQELYELTGEDAEQQTGLPAQEFGRLVNFLVAHRELELHPRQRGELSKPVSKLVEAKVESGDERFDYVTRQLGLLVGTDLYDAYLAGRARRSNLRHLFLARLDESGVAPETYFSLVGKLRKEPRP